MRSTWQIQEAKNRFSELIAAAHQHGPQTVTKHGRAVVQVVPIKGLPIKGPVATEAGAVVDNTAPGLTPAAASAPDRFASHLLNAPKLDRAMATPKRRNRKAAAL